MSQLNDYCIINFLAIYFPLALSKEDYLSIMHYIIFGTESIYNSQETIEKYLMESVKRGDLIINNNYIIINWENYLEIKNKTDRKIENFKDKILKAKNRLLDNFRSHEKAVIISALINLNYDIINKLNYNSSLLLLNKVIDEDLRENKFNLNFYNYISVFFDKNLLNDDVKIRLINIFYKYNKNSFVNKLYENIHNEILDWNILLKISNAYLMQGEYEKSDSIILKLEEKYNNDYYVKDIIHCVKLQFEYESNSPIDKTKLENEFWDLSSKWDNTSHCSMLLSKFASSILPHKKAIEYMKNSNTNISLINIYNNLGALNLSEAARQNLTSILKSQYIIKAKNYLEFAQFLGKEKKEFTPYLNLNILTYKLFTAYYKKQRKNLYKIYCDLEQIKHESDSIYFKSILLCNSLIIETLININKSKKDKIKNELVTIKNYVKDEKIISKIQLFLEFKSNFEQRLPVWIITETHY